MSKIGTIWPIFFFEKWHEIDPIGPLFSSKITPRACARSTLWSLIFYLFWNKKVENSGPKCALGLRPRRIIIFNGASRGAEGPEVSGVKNDKEARPKAELQQNNKCRPESEGFWPAQGGESREGGEAPLFGSWTKSSSASSPHFGTKCGRMSRFSKKKIGKGGYKGGKRSFPPLLGVWGWNPQFFLSNFFLKSWFSLKFKARRLRSSRMSRQKKKRERKSFLDRFCKQNREKNEGRWPATNCNFSFGKWTIKTRKHHL